MVVIIATVIVIIATMVAIKREAEGFWGTLGFKKGVRLLSTTPGFILADVFYSYKKGGKHEEHSKISPQRARIYAD